VSPFVNVALTYATVGLAAAVFAHYILRQRVIGGFWIALVVGLVGAALGGLIDQVLADVIERLANFNSVNVFAAGLSALLLIWLFGRVSGTK
jgi:uncharacterized membrane protein YeaQ/YmgE (transglycosylase-associated protein family)